MTRRSIRRRFGVGDQSRIHQPGQHAVQSPDLNAHGARRVFLHPLHDRVAIQILAGEHEQDVKVER
jgi:hypothetical protein